ncbi:hypothetical protein [Kutzneria sp. 744]|uniref:hypothetical protein n=1 Tax=Kutzneria sp. (strain 744) TaxID=345341 RepID=UPI0003EED2E1|nr:hypothetical protein [Kutzneria sp. 744]EWM19664.1 hypothetical protein KUTG_09968 [Kutzneria sp. 744]
MTNPTIRHITDIPRARLQGLYTLTRYYRVGVTTLCAVVARTPDLATSTATLSRYGADHAWIPVATEPATTWHHRTPLWGHRASTPNGQSGFAVLREIADRLLDHALITVPELQKLE